MQWIHNGARRNAGLALLLLVPAPTVGSVTVLVVMPGPVGQCIYFACKLWLLALPMLWLRLVDRRPFSFSPPRRGGFAVAIALGLLISLSIVAGYMLLGQHLVDVKHFLTITQGNHLDSSGRYVAFSLYIIGVNSLLEEYIWRWFVFSKWHLLTRGAGRGWLAVVLAAVCFTIHHVLVLRAQFGWSATVIASSGVFIGGAVWSWCYLRYESIWPGYISHAIVDVAVLAVGWWLLFGN